VCHVGWLCKKQLNGSALCFGMKLVGPKKHMIVPIPPRRSTQPLLNYFGHLLHIIGVVAVCGGIVGMLSNVRHVMSVVSGVMTSVTDVLHWRLGTESVLLVVVCVVSMNLSCLKL